MTDIWMCTTNMGLFLIDVCLVIPIFTKFLLIKIKAHCIYLTESEKKKMAEKGTSIVHCPDSNFSLMSGVLDHQGAIDANINVALGNTIELKS